MIQIKKRQKIKRLAEEVKEVAETPVPKPKSIRMEQTVSTGSTLLDLAISGGRKREGGVPGGIIVEIFGPSGSGKTSLLAEIMASVQRNGGSARFLDPEGRLDQEYAKIYGMELDKKDYYRPDTVTEVFNDYIWPWEPKNPKVINAVGTDSLAALSTMLELEKGDKMGMRRAKEFSEGLRKTCRRIANNNWLIACTNQVRESDTGEVTPGGKGIPFYSSLRIRVKEEEKIEKTVKLKFDKKDKEEGEEKKKEKAVVKVMGIKSLCHVKKSTIDDPYRSTYVYIVFGYGLDDVRANLQYLKDMTGDTRYDCVERSFQSMDKAIQYIEENGYQDELREKVINLWHEIEDKFKMERKEKGRF